MREGTDFGKSAIRFFPQSVVKTGCTVTPSRLLNQASDPAAERQALVARQPMGRLGAPEKVAAFITGTSLVIDGVLTAR